MKILLTADPIGGVWNYALELCEALQPSRTQVALATLGRALTATQRAQVTALPNVTLHESSFRLEWMPNPWDDLARAGDWLLDLERKCRPDVVQLNHLVHADLEWQAPVVSVAHSCVLSWWSAVRGGRPGTEWSTYERRVTASLQAARYVVAPTHAMLAALERYYGPFSQTAVIHNARNGRLFASHPRHKERMVFCAGRLWDEAKNVAALAAVAPHINAPVLLAGESQGPHGNLAAIPGLQVLGQLDPELLASWYAKAAIYTLPARYEPFGLTALEAGLSGCALVLGDIDSLREVWGAAALYVEPDDHTGLCDTLNALLANDPLRTAMAGRALARARQLNPARFVQLYSDLYRRIQCDSRCSITP
jgi:glycogen synthase